MSTCSTAGRATRPIARFRESSQPLKAIASSRINALWLPRHPNKATNKIHWLSIHFIGHRWNCRHKKTRVVAGFCLSLDDSGLRIGGGKRDRTADLLHAMQALSQLSYTPGSP